MPTLIVAAQRYRQLTGGRVPLNVQYEVLPVLQRATRRRAALGTDDQRWDVRR